VGDESDFMPAVSQRSASLGNPFGGEHQKRALKTKSIGRAPHGAPSCRSTLASVLMNSDAKRSGKRPFSVRSHEIARINHLITIQLDLMCSSFAFRFDSMSFVFGKTAAMSERSIPLGQEFVRGDSDPTDPVVANLQQSPNLANDNCDRAAALAQTLSAQLREAQDRINQLESEADGLGDQLLAEAKAIIQEVRSNADARVNRAIREADARIDRMKVHAQDQVGRLQNELTQSTRGIDQVKDEAGTRIENV